MGNGNGSSSSSGGSGSRRGGGSSGSKGILFEPLAIASLQAKNRLVRAATYTGLATESGHLTPELRAVYAELAAGGTGTIVTEYAYITPDEQPNPRMMGIYDDSFVTEYRTLTDAVHEQGARMVLQIVYGGSATRMNPPSSRILGPSAVANPKTGVVPLEASDQELHDLAQAFADAAARAQAAGFDGVELHAAHGYLLSQFLSPLLNRRTDAYGGSPQNRARFVAECVQAVRGAVAPDFPVLVKLNSSDGVEGGLTEEDSLVAAQLLAESGTDAIEVSGAWRTFGAQDTDGTPYFAGYAKQLAAAVDIPVLLTGGCRNLQVMEHLAAEAGIAGFGLCRPLICEPDLVNRWQADPAYRPRCVSCNQCSATPGHRCILA